MFAQSLTFWQDVRGWNTQSDLVGLCKHRRWEFRQTKPEHVDRVSTAALWPGCLCRDQFFPINAKWSMISLTTPGITSETGFNKIQQHPSRGTCPGLKVYSAFWVSLYRFVSSAVLFFCGPHLFPQQETKFSVKITTLMQQHCPSVATPLETLCFLF